MARRGEELRSEWWALLSSADSGVLGTHNPSGAIDLVPVVFAVTADRRVVLPVDTVKVKRTMRLQRIVNLEADPTCSLIVDHYDQDWSMLWWVRIQGTATVGEPTPAAVELLAGKYTAYRQPGSIVEIIELTPDRITGWRAG